MKKCKTCDNEIPQARIEALPNTDTCVEHSEETPYVGYNVYYHKTAPEVIKTKAKNTEAIRQMRRAYKRSR